jgi:hypothetical protein
MSKNMVVFGVNGRKACYLQDMDLRCSRDSLVLYAIKKHRIDMSNNDLLIIDGANKDIRRVYKYIHGNYHLYQINLGKGKKFEPLAGCDCLVTREQLSNILSYVDSNNGNLVTY